MNLITYFRDTVSELKLVHWPTANETFKLTGIVIGISVLVGGFVGLLDFSFTNILTLVIK